MPLFLRKGLFIVLFSSPILAMAQVGNYIFSQTIGTFSPITGGQLQGSSDNDNESFNDIALGFNFIFAGKVYNKVSINSDGFIAMGSTVLSSYTAISSGLTDNVISGLNFDMYGTSLAASELMSLTSGTSPNKVFTVQWRNYSNNSNFSDRYNFQIKLYEGSNAIEIVYGPMTHTFVSYYAQVGLRGIGTNDYNNRKVLGVPTDTWATSAAGTAPGSTCFLDGYTGSIPPEGLTYRWELPALDAGITALPSPDGCFGKDQVVIARLSNLGKSTINFSSNPVTVTASVKGTNPQTFTPLTINSGTLAAGAYQDVPLGSNYDMSANGDYIFNASASMTGDAFAGNNTLPAVTRKVLQQKPVPLPQNIDFTSFTGTNLEVLFEGWREASGTKAGNTGSAWTSASNDQQTWFDESGMTARVSLYGTDRKEWIISPKFIAGPTTLVKFKAAVTTSFTTSVSDMGSDDQVQVLVSTDCGLSWSTAYVFEQASGISNSLNSYSVNLGSYAGEQIIVAFYATDGKTDDTESYDFHLDDISIRNIITDDIGVRTILSPVRKGCSGTALPVKVVVGNFGTAIQNNIPLVFSISGPESYVFYDTVATLLPDRYDTVLFTSSFNSMPGGTFKLKAYTILNADTLTSNDTVIMESVLSNNTIPLAEDTTILCQPGSANLEAAGTGLLNWFDVPSGGTPLAQGTSFLTPYLTAPKTYYVQNSTFFPNDMTTNYSGINGAWGNMFDLTAINGITIDSFDVHLSDDAFNTIELWYKKGTYKGYENDSAAWTFHNFAEVNGNGIGMPTRVPVGGLTIPKGETYGIYITASTSGVMRYLATTANNTISDGNISLELGIGNAYPFLDIYKPRMWNGTLYYTVECESPRKSIAVLIGSCNGIQDPSMSGISLYPNPSEGTVRIEPSKILAGICLVELIDMHGKQVYAEKRYITEAFSLDLHRYPAGVYQVRISSEEEFHAQKLILH